MERMAAAAARGCAERGKEGSCRCRCSLQLVATRDPTLPLLLARRPFQLTEQRKHSKGESVS